MICNMIEWQFLAPARSAGGLVEAISLCSRYVYHVARVYKQMLMQQKPVWGINGISYLPTLVNLQLEVDYSGGYYTGRIFYSIIIVWICFSSFVNM